MSNDYIIRYEDAITNIKILNDEITNKYKNKLNINFDVKTNNSQTEMNVSLPISILTPMQMTIGIKNLINNTQKNYVNSNSLVNTIQSIYHEEQHVYQHAILYASKETPKYIQDMAQIQTICNNIPEYYKLTYFRNPSEIDAETYSFEKTSEYFNNHFLNNKHEPLIDAKNELIQTINNKYKKNIGWFGDKKAINYENAMKSLQENKNFHKDHIPQILTYPWSYKSKTLQKLLQNKTFVTAYTKCESAENARNIIYYEIVNNYNSNLLHYKCLKSIAQNTKTNKQSRYELAKNKFQSIFKNDKTDELEK